MAQVTIYIKDDKLIKRAHELKVNVSRVCEDAIRHELTIAEAVGIEMEDLLWQRTR